MVAPLLQTKLFIPRPRPDQVPRPALLSRLRQAAAHGVVLLSAPAGYGKTSLLAEWLSRMERGTAVAWLALDEEDNDPVRFWRYVAAALQSANQNLARELTELLHAHQPAPPPAAVACLVNQAVALEQPVVLVLDDLHRITNGELLDSLAFLAQNLPPLLQLVLATRADPPLPLARLRARGQLLELRAAQLRFDEQEAAQLLESQLQRGPTPRQLEPQQLAALTERTEGWVSGLQLASLALAQAADPAAFIATFSGSHQYVLDFLMDEVLAQQPAEVTDFLVHTSVLPRFDAASCDALMPQQQSQLLLERLQRENLFVVPLDDERRWYRYHHLFRDLLRRRLQQLPEKTRSRLYRDGATALAQRASLGEAIDLALEGGQPDLAATWLETESVAAFARGEMTTFQRWIRALPAEEIQARHCLSSQVAWSLVLAGQMDPADQLLQQLEQRAHSGDEQHLLTLRGHVALMRAIQCDKRRDPQQALHWVDQAQQLIPDAPDQQMIRGMIPFTRGRALAASGELEPARAIFLAVEQVGQQMNNIWPVATGYLELVSLDHLQGELGALEQRLDRLDQLAREMNARHFGTVAPLDAWRATLLLERDQLEPARELALTARRNLTDWRNPNGQCQALAVLVGIELAQGQHQAAGQWATAIDQLLAEQQPYPLPRALARGAQVRWWLASGQLERVTAWASALQTERRGGLIIEELEDLQLCRVLIAQRRFNEALQLLDRLCVQAAAGNRSGRLVEIHAPQASALQLAGQHSRALAALLRAMELGAPRGFIRTITDAGPNLELLLATGLRRQQLSGPLLQHAEQLQLALQRHTPHSTTQQPPAPGERLAATAQELSEPLSERELEVLQLVADGMSDRQIAKQLFVSLSTVKSHVHNASQKLEADNRVQAVARARGLGLL